MKTISIKFYRDYFSNLADLKPAYPFSYMIGIRRIREQVKLYQENYIVVKVCSFVFGIKYQTVISKTFFTHY